MRLSKNNNSKLTKKRKVQDYKYKCLIIGSFRKYYQDILNIIDLFHQKGIKVLSPKKSFIINPEEEFVIFDYDPKKASEKEIEDAVLEKMHRVDFVYLVNPNGYIGISASFEVGYCAAHGIKVFAMESTSELCAKYLYDIKKPEEIAKLYNKEI